MAQARGEAMADVGEKGMAGINTAAETLRSYGINPASPRYAAMYTTAQPMLGAAEAAAGTKASQDLRAQQMQLEQSAIGTGRGVITGLTGLTGAGTSAGQAGAGAASGAGATAQGNLSTGSQAMTAPANWFNAGSNAMNTYVNAVNGYNDSQAKFDASSGSGFGSMLGMAGGLLTKALPMGFLAKGGAVGYADGGPALPGIPGMPSYQTTPDQGGGMTGIPSMPMMPRQVYNQGGDAGATPSGTVPIQPSTSGGVATVNVPAMLRVDEVEPIVGQLAYQRVRGITGDVIHDGKYPAVGFGARLYIDSHLIAEGQNVSSGKVAEKPLKEDAVEIIFLHPFEMAHDGLLFVSGIEFRGRAV
jgi:hypothetical protein